MQPLKFKSQVTFAFFAAVSLAYEQALWGALAAGREKEGEHATTSLEFEYLLRKRLWKVLIGGDDISNDIITLGTCFSMSVCICSHFRLALIGGNLTAQSTGVTGELEVEFKFQGRSCKLSFLFLPRRQSVPEKMLTGYRQLSEKRRVKVWFKIGGFQSTLSVCGDFRRH